MSKRIRFAGCLLTAMLICIPAVQAQTVEGRIGAQLKKLQPDLGIEQIEKIDGSALYEVQLKGGQFLYMDETAEFIMHGQLYRVNDEQTVNLTEQAQKKVNAALLAKIQADDMVVFPSQSGEAKTHITVFTDVDCGYCQKLHNEVPELNRAGIEVRYLAWPRQGLTGTTFNTMQSIWCADDRQDAMTRAKRRESIETATCKNPIERQYALGHQLGLRGTPAIVLENGELVPGYMPAAQLVAKALQAKQ